MKSPCFWNEDRFLYVIFSSCKFETRFRTGSYIFVAINSTPPHTSNSLHPFRSHEGGEFYLYNFQKLGFLQ